MKSGELFGGREALDSRNASVSPDVLVLGSAPEMRSSAWWLLCLLAAPCNRKSKPFIAFLTVILALCHFSALFSLKDGGTPCVSAATAGVNGLFFRLLSEYMQGVCLGYQPRSGFTTKVLHAERDPEYGLRILSLVRTSDPGITTYTWMYKSREKPCL